MGVPKPPDARDLRYLKLVSGRQEGLDEEQIAKLAGEESPTFLYERISEDGHPICPKCGTTYVDETHCEIEQQVGTQGDVSTRRTRKSGPVEELPLARDAIPLVREALENLARENEELKYRRDSRQGKHYPYRIVSRGSVPDDERTAIVERLGLDDVDRSTMYFDGAEIKYGASPRVPASPLPELIGTYLLAGGDVGKLVEKLHPKDSEPNWPEITRYIEGRTGGARHQDGIKSMAARLAILVFGGTLDRGQPPPQMSGHDLNLSHRIASELEAGVPRKQLYEEMLTKFGLSEEEFPWSEFCRLAKLGLELPRSAEEPK
jgi:hypothetical protein